MGTHRTFVDHLSGRRSTLLAVAAGAAAIAGVASAPAGSVGFAATSTTPTASSPGPAAMPSGPGLRPWARFPRSGVLTAGQHAVVLTQREGTTATLLIGVDRAVPTVAPGAGALPSWAQPHVGSDASGQRVVVYPRCTGADVSSCDLYQYDIDAATERPVSGVNAAGVGEVEGSIERGAIAFSRWTLSRQPQDGDFDASTALYYRPAGGKVRLVTRNGGQQIALHRRQVVLVRDVQPSYGECGRPAVQLLRLSGGRRVLRAYRCGLDGHHPVSPAFLGDRVIWAMVGISEVQPSRWEASRCVVVTDRVVVDGAVAYAPVTWRTAVLLVADHSTPATTPTWVLTSISEINLFPALTSVRSRCSAHA